MRHVDVNVCLDTFSLINSYLLARLQTNTSVVLRSVSQED